MEWWDPHSQGVGGVATNSVRQPMLSGQSYTPAFHPLPLGQPIHSSTYEQVSPTFQTSALPVYPSQSTSSHHHSAHLASTRTAVADATQSSHDPTGAYYGRAPEARRMPQYPPYEDVPTPAGPGGSVFVLPQPSTATAGGTGYTASAAPRYLPPAPSPAPQQYLVDSHRRYTEPSLQHPEPHPGYHPPQRHSYAGHETAPSNATSNSLRTPAGPVYWSQSSTPTPFWAGDHLPIVDTSSSTSTSHSRSPVPVEFDARYELSRTTSASTTPLNYSSSGVPQSSGGEDVYDYDDARSRRTSATSTGSDSAHPGYGGYGGRGTYGGDDGSWSDGQVYEGGRQKKRQKRQRMVSAGSDGGNNSRKFACEMCGQRFARPSALATHTKHEMESADRQRAKLHANGGGGGGGGKPPSEEEYFDVLFQRERTMSAPSRGRTFSGQSNSSSNLGFDMIDLERQRHSVA